MEAGDVSLDDLIKKDKTQKKNKPRDNRQHKDDGGNPRRTKPIHKLRQPRRRSHSNQPRQPRGRQEYRSQRPARQERYALLIKGFVADVSTEDIYNILKDRKVLSVKTFLSSEDGRPLKFQHEMPIDVKITFTNKEDADSLMKEYSNKVLDGKRSLEFSFVRG